MNDLFGTDPYLLAKSDDPHTSKEAAEAFDTTRLEADVYNYIRSSGDAGVTIAQCVLHFNPTSQGSITSRPAALERKGLIYYAGDTRTGASNRQQRVIRVNRRKVKQGVWNERRQPETPKVSLKEENEQLKAKISELESLLDLAKKTYPMPLKGEIDD